MLISQAAIDLIVSEEVSSRKTYEARYRHPIWPGANSGVTIGIGYDVGAGVRDSSQLYADWTGRIPGDMIALLSLCIGVTGDHARQLLPSVQSVDVPWDAAMAVFKEQTLPAYYGKCAKTLPNFEVLSPDCKGALVSLVYNRGASFANDGDRYREMRAIKAHMVARDFTKIPDELRAMKRIWAGQGLPGLLIRRDLEAELFTRGLSAPQPRPTPVPRPPVGAPVKEPVAIGAGGGLLATLAHALGASPATVVIILVFAAIAAGVAYVVLRRRS